MIGRISGILLEKNPPQLLVDVQGVGYEVDVPMSTFYNLPPTGDKVSLFTHLVVREDAHLLFGFLTERERMTFRQLLKISGVGARTALSVLSGQLSITWGVEDEMLALAWEETGGPLVQIPTSRGFGTRSLMASVESQLGGQALFDWRTEGLICRLVVPLAREASVPMLNERFEELAAEQPFQQVS